MATTSTPTGQPLDTSVMPTLHTFFRRETRLAGGLLRGVAAGDVRRARIVAEHLDFVTRHLHHHHGIEDRLLWPILLERVPEELAPLVHLMERSTRTSTGCCRRSRRSCRPSPRPPTRPSAVGWPS